VLEVAGRSRSLWVMQRVKSAAIGRGLDKSASLFERTVNNPVCHVLLQLSMLAQYNKIVVRIIIIILLLIIIDVLLYQKVL